MLQNLVIFFKSAEGTTQMIGNSCYSCYFEPGSSDRFFGGNEIFKISGSCMLSSNQFGIYRIIASNVSCKVCLLVYRLYKK